MQVVGPAPMIIDRHDNTLMDVHWSVAAQCDRTRVIENTLYTALADGVIDEADTPLILRAAKLAMEEHSDNLYCDAKMDEARNENEEIRGLVHELRFKFQELRRAMKKRTALASGPVQLSAR